MQEVGCCHGDSPNRLGRNNGGAYITCSDWCDRRKGVAMVTAGKMCSNGGNQWSKEKLCDRPWRPLPWWLQKWTGLNQLRCFNWICVSTEYGGMEEGCCNEKRWKGTLMSVHITIHGTNLWIKGNFSISLYINIIVVIICEALFKYHKSL